MTRIRLRTIHFFELLVLTFSRRKCLTKDTNFKGTKLYQVNWGYLLENGAVKNKRLKMAR